MIGSVIRMLMRQGNLKFHQRNRILINSLLKDRLRVSSNQYFPPFSLLYTSHKVNREKKEARKKEKEWMRDRKRVRVGGKGRKNLYFFMKIQTHNFYVLQLLDSRVRTIDADDTRRAAANDFVESVITFANTGLTFLILRIFLKYL